jgi:hypothetical protein
MAETESYFTDGEYVAAHSDATRAPIPMERGQSFRLIAGSDSDATRAVGEGGLTTTAG